MTNYTRTNDYSEIISKHGRRIIWSFIPIIAATMLYISMFFTRYSDTETAFRLLVFGLLFAGGWAALLINAINFFRVNSPPTPPPTRIHSGHRPPPARIETTTNKTIKLGRYSFTENQWRRLHDALNDNHWRWTRRTVAKAKVFERITTAGVYPKVTEDFERLHIVEEGRVVGPARAKLRYLAGIR